jgi:hypothetical protein
VAPEDRAAGFATVKTPNGFQSMHFDSPANQRVLIVFGSRYEGVPPGGLRDVYCGTVSQGILVTKDEVRLSSRIARGGIRCSGMPVDATQFRMFNESRPGRDAPAGEPPR